MLRLLRQISLPQLRASWGRTALVVGGIATGVTLIVAIHVINASVLENFRRSIELMAGPAALEVVLGVGEVGFSEEATVAAVAGDPDVVAAIPFVRGTVAPADDPARALALFGADLVAEEDLQRYQITTATDRRALLRMMEDPDSILVGSTFAESRGLAAGDRIALVTPSGVRDLTVRGLLETRGLAALLGGELAVMDLPAAQMALGKEGRIDQIDVVLRPAAAVDAVAARLRRALPAELSVIRPARRGAQYQRFLASFQAMLTGISTLCLVAGIFIVYNTTATGAVQRALAMAGLRLAGADAAQLFRLLMLEACVLGIAGALLGIPIGIGMAWLLIGMVADSMGVIFKLRFPVQTLALDGRALAVAGCAGVLAALFASYFAARRIERLEPLAVLRAGARLPEGRPDPWRYVRGWALLVAASAILLALGDRMLSIALGNLGATLWNASVIVVAIPVMIALRAPATRILSALFSAAGRVAAESLFRAPARPGVIVAAIALVLTTAVVLTALSHSFRDSASDYVGHLFRADLVVSAVTTEGGYLEVPLPAVVLDEVAAVPGVTSVEAARVLAGQSYQGERIGLVALSDGFFTPERYPPSWYRAGDPEAAGAALRAGTGVNVSTALADRFQLAVGDELELASPTGLVRVPIVGVVGDYISDRGSVILNRRLLVERWRDPAVHRVSVYLAPGTAAAAVRRGIEARLGARFRLKILSLAEVLEYHDAYRRRAFAFTDAIQLLVVIVTIAGVFDLLLATIVERRRELAVWRLIGADDRSLRRAVMLESGTIGAVGAVLGIAVSAVTAWIWVRINFRQLLGYDLAFSFPLLSTAWYAALVLAMTVLAGYLAASRAVRSPILEGIQVD